MYTLYTGKYTRGLLVEMVMAEGGIEYERVDVDITRGEHRQPDYLKVNAAGWVPVLQLPDGYVLSETPAINLYLCEHHRLTQLAPAIDDPERGAFLSSLFYITGEIEPALKRFWYPHYFGAGETTRAAIETQAVDSILHGFSIVDRRLAADGPCHLGERFSLPDLMVAYWASSFEAGSEINAALNALPALRTCVDIARSRPKLRPLFELHDAWNSETDDDRPA